MPKKQRIDSHPQGKSITEVVRKQCPDCGTAFPGKTIVCPHDGSHLTTVIERSLVGLTLDSRYELMEELGKGGMGVIYKAKDRQSAGESEQIVAIKLLLNHAAKDDIVRTRFMVEARAAKVLNHPNVVKVHEYSISPEGLPFIVMDFLPGRTLDDLLSAGEINVQEAVTLIAQVCDGLGHAHRHNVIHRDVKPTNIMVISEQDGTKKAVIVDFGIAKVFAQPGKTSLRLTQTGEIFGTPLYMSPEQCMGQRPDSRADIYALGCVLFECINGELPFSGESILNVIFKHVNEEPRRFANTKRERLLESVVLKALLKNLRTGTNR